MILVKRFSFRLPIELGRFGFTAEQISGKLSIGPREQILLYCSRWVVVPIRYGKPKNDSDDAISILGDQRTLCDPLAIIN